MRSSRLRDASCSTIHHDARDYITRRSCLCPWVRSWLCLRSLTTALTTTLRDARDYARKCAHDYATRHSRQCSWLCLWLRVRDFAFNLCLLLFSLARLPFWSMIDVVVLSWTRDESMSLFVVSWRCDFSHHMVVDNTYFERNDSYERRANSYQDLNVSLIIKFTSCSRARVVRESWQSGNRQL